MNDFDFDLQVEDSSAFAYYDYLEMQELNAFHDANRLTPDDLEAYASAFDFDVSLELV
jgi:hypothetical protein